MTLPHLIEFQSVIGFCNAHVWLTFICFLQFTGSTIILAIKRQIKVSSVFTCNNVSIAILCITQRHSLCLSSLPMNRDKLSDVYSLHFLIIFICVSRIAGQAMSSLRSVPHAPESSSGQALRLGFYPFCFPEAIWREAPGLFVYFLIITVVLMSSLRSVP